MQYFLKSAVGPNSDLQRITVFDPVLLFRDSEEAQEMIRRYKECFSPQFSGRINFFPPSSSSKGAALYGSFSHFVDQLQNDSGDLFFKP
jgi:hypothetical protein